MRFYIIRHGESVGNLNKICLGHTDLGLTDKGREQALLTAKALEGVEFFKIYSSDLIRAVETAVPNAALRGLGVSDIVRSDKLRELYFGDWENAAVEDLKNNYGDMFNVGWRHGFGTFTPPNGESVPALAERMCSALASIARECELNSKSAFHSGDMCEDGVNITADNAEKFDKNIDDNMDKNIDDKTDKNIAENIDAVKNGVNILVVTHAASIRAFWGKISGYSAENVCAAVPFPSNASYSIADYDLNSGVFTPVLYSVDEHLGGIRTALLG